MAIITAPEEIAKLRRSGQILAAALRSVAKAVKPGVSSGELNEIAAQEIKAGGGQPAFQGYQGYPAALCVSVNHEVVHGIPDPNRKINNSDVVGLDLGVVYQGMFTDHAVTVGAGKISRQAKDLISAARESLAIGLRQIRADAHLGDIGAAIQQYLEPKGYGIVRQLTGHGIGRAIHESPPIPNTGEFGTGPKLTVGQVLAIEPMVTTGDWRVATLADGWTVVTVDQSLAAHFEHTVIVTANGVEIITV